MLVNIEEQKCKKDQRCNDIDGDHASGDDGGGGSTHRDNKTHCKQRAKHSRMHES